MAKRKRIDEGGLVYSTDHGRMCPRCERPVDACVCGTSAAGPTAPGAQRVRVRRETKGRKGKTVTVVEGLALDPFTLADLAKDLKQRCGSGGTAKDDRIEIQGDHVDTIVQTLTARGFDARRAGG